MSDKQQKPASAQPSTSTSPSDTRQASGNKRDDNSAPPAKASSDIPANTQPQTKPTPNRTTTAYTGGRSGGRLLAILALLLGLIAIGVCGWLWQQLQAMHQQQVGFAQQQSAAQTQASKAQQDTLRLAADQKTIRQQISDQTAGTEQLSIRLHQAEQQLLQLAGRRPNDWLLAEANYLVTLAQHRLWLEHDLFSAVKLLQVADQRIAQLQDPSLLNLRQAIADDVAQLRALNQPDREALALQLNAIQRLISDLPLSSVVLPDTIDDTEVQPLSEDPNDWRANLRKSWASLTDGFITVRERTGPVQPLLAPDQHWFLVENLRTKLLQAQLALYREQQAVWQDSLGQALSWTEGYFDNDAPATREILRQLTQLSQTQISASYPEDLTVRSLLEDTLAERTSLNDPVRVPETSVSDTETPVETAVDAPAEGAPVADFSVSTADDKVTTAPPAEAEALNENSAENQPVAQPEEEPQI